MGCASAVTEVTSTIGTTWNTLAAVPVERAASWGVLVAVTSGKGTSWRVLTTVVGDRHFSWDIYWLNLYESWGMLEL